MRLKKINNKIDIRKEIKVGGIYFFIVVLFSIHSSLSREIIAEELYREFHVDLFILNLLAWVIIYVLVRGGMLAWRLYRE